MLSRLCSSAASARTLPLIHAARAASTLATASRQQQQQQQRQQQQRRSGLVGLLGAAAAAVVGMGVANAEDKKKKTNEKLAESDGGLLYTYEEDGVKKAILFTKTGATEVNLDTPAPAEEAPQPKKASEAEVKAAVTKLTDDVAGLERALGYLPPSQQSKGDNGFPKFTAKSKSLLKKHLTKEVYLQCKDRVTPSGFTLDQAMQSGVDNQDSGVGLYAGDEAAYTVFAPLFDRIIEDYHGGYKPDAKHTSDLDVSKVQGNLTEAGDAIVSTRIRVGRNIRGLGLSPGISRAERREVERIVVKALNNMTGDLAGKYYSLGAMTEAERKQLVDDHFLFKKGDRFLQSAGANRDWPESRGIFHNQEKTFLVWLNEEDQLRIISMQPGGDVKGIFDRLVRAINAIEAEVKAAGYEFSYNDHLGFIHSCPTNCGTGMRASVHVKLANASKHPQFNEWCDKLRLQPRGIHGEHSETDGGVFDISNKERLGKSEVQLVQTMIDGVNALLQADAALAKGESAEAVSKRILG